MSKSSPSSLVESILTQNQSSDASSREVSAHEVRDIHSSLSPRDIESIFRALVDARLVEESMDCQEAQLNALSEIVTYHQVPKSEIARILTVEGNPSDPTQLEHLETLRQAIEW